MAPDGGGANRVGTARTFEFGSCLGRGGQGEAYRASLRSAGGLVQDVVVKLSNLDLPKGAVRRLRDEGRALARLNHPNIVQVVDLVELEGRAAVVTAYVPGVDAASVVRELSPAAAAEVASALASALTVTAAAGVVHRDVKPANVRLGPHGDVKLIDFGLAWAPGDREAHTASNVLVGSVPYLAPERFLERQARPAADVFGLGAVLYELLAGDKLHEGASITTISTRAADPAVYAAWLDQRLAALPPTARVAVPVLRRMLAWDPEQRPTAEAVAPDLEALARTLPGAPLRAWARARAWPDPPLVGAVWEGRVLDESLVDEDDVTTTADRTALTGARPAELGVPVRAFAEVAPLPSVETLPPRRAPRGKVAEAATLPIAPPPRPASSSPSRGPLLAAVAVGAVGIGALATFALLGVAGVVMWLTGSY